MRSRAFLRAEATATGTRLVHLRSAPPLSLRPTPHAVVLVGSAAGPVGGDDLHLIVELGDHAQVTLTTVAASVALPGRNSAPSRLRVTARLGRAAGLRWIPGPLVAAAGSDHHTFADVDLAESAWLEWRDELILGRYGEAPGSCRTQMRVDYAGHPLTRHELHTDLPAAHGPAGLNHAQAAGSLLLVDDGLADAETDAFAPNAALLPLDGPGAFVNALASDAVELRSLLDHGRARHVPAVGAARDRHSNAGSVEPNSSSGRSGRHGNARAPAVPSTISPS